MLAGYNLKTLLVDDLGSMRQMMRVQLRDIGVGNVREAANAWVALEHLREARQVGEPFDLLVLDYYLGDSIDGQQLLETVRNERLVPSTAVVVMVTAENDYGRVARVAEQAPDGYLIKPFNAEKLGQKILPALQRKLGMRDYGKATPGLKPLLDLYDAGKYEACVQLCDAYAGREGLKSDVARIKADSLFNLGDVLGAKDFCSGLANTYP